MKINGVVFDWAGTVMDYGCFSPLGAFIEAFADKKITLTMEEARKPMGMLKIDHTRALFQMESVRKQFEEIYGRQAGEEDVREFYGLFEDHLFRVLTSYVELNPHVTETVTQLRNREIHIGSTTGYTKAMMDCILPVAKEKGYEPEVCIASDELGYGRPYPYMMYENARRMNIFPMKSMIKVGDTEVDMQEGKNAGCICVGLILGSSVLGLTKEEVESMEREELENRKSEVRAVLKAAGADYVIDDLSGLIPVIDELEALDENVMNVPENDYLLLTPGPLSTSRRVRNGLLKDMCTWDRDYNDIVQDIRRKLLKAACCSEETYTAVLMQGSGSFGVESVIGSAAGKDARLLVLVNGAYGRRIAEMADYCGVEHEIMEFPEDEICRSQDVDAYLKEHAEITHVAFVHSETTTGVLNPVDELAVTVKKHGKVCIVDAMSSFGGVPIEVEKLGIDYLISSANKCIQGVPGFSFVLSRKEVFLKTKGNARSLSLDLYAQWETMEKDQGKWRFTSPTHVVRAFYEAILEFEEEGVEKRYQRYMGMQQLLSRGMDELGYRPYINPAYQGPVITTFLCPDEDFSFADFYQYLKKRGFVIYPGKISTANTFRIGNIGALKECDIRHLLHIVADYHKYLNA